MLVRKIWPEIPKCKKSSDSLVFSNPRKRYKKDIPVALSTTPKFQINRFEKLEKIMNENNKSAPQSWLSISAHQVKCNKKIELMSFFHKWIGHKNHLTSRFFH